MDLGLGSEILKMGRRQSVRRLVLREEVARLEPKDTPSSLRHREVRCLPDWAVGLVFPPSTSVCWLLQHLPRSHLVTKQASLSQPKNHHEGRSLCPARIVSAQEEE